MAEESAPVLDAPATPAAEGQPGQAPHADLEVIKRELETLKGRYEESSREGKRLADELRGEREKRESSLTQPPQYPPEEVVVKHLMEERDFTEKQARHIYEMEKFFHNRDNEHDSLLRAMSNQMRFGNQQVDKAIESSNPMLREANEVFKDNPQLMGLPAMERLEMFKSLKERLAPKVGERDLSAIKRAAGGSMGGNARSMAASDDSATSEAQKLGFTSAREVEELGKCNTQADYNAWAKRWKK